MCDLTHWRHDRQSASCHPAEVTVLTAADNDDPLLSVSCFIPPSLPFMASPCFTILRQANQEHVLSVLGGEKKEEKPSKTNVRPNAGWAGGYEERGVLEKGDVNAAWVIFWGWVASEGGCAGYSPEHKALCSHCFLCRGNRVSVERPIRAEKKHYSIK